MSYKFSARGRRIGKQEASRKFRKKTRRYCMELLEDRCLLATDWHNASLPGDVNNSQLVTALDALIVINELDKRKASDAMTGKLLSRSSSILSAEYSLDVTGDGYVTADDARQILSFLSSESNQHWRRQGSAGISISQPGMASHEIPDDVLQAFFLAADLSQYSQQQLLAASGWVILTTGQQEVSKLRNQLSDSNSNQSPTTSQTRLGISHLKSVELIQDTYIVSWDSVSPETPLKKSSDEMIRRLRDNSSIIAFYPLIPISLETRFVPNDALYASQWHLKNRGQSLGTPGIDVNIERAWDQYQGNGIVIGIVDDGLQRTHEDLASNTWLNPLEDLDGIDEDGNGLVDDIYGWDFLGNDNDPSPAAGYGHGTSAAGVAAGRGNNGIGISGSAPRAELVGIRLLDLPSSSAISSPVNDAVIAGSLSYQSQQIHIYNNSWGPADDGRVWRAGPLALAALRSGVTSGRAGLGSIYVWAGGNGHKVGDNSNNDGLANSRYVIAVGANGADGARSDYSEQGANILVAAPSNNNDLRSSITTTDLEGADGYNPGTFAIPANAALCNPAGTQNYTNCFGGTSSAAPLVSGVVGLMLEANPSLTWRDVKHILVETSKPINPDQVVQPGNPALQPSTGWQRNIAGKLFNHDFGFGMVDAWAAVNLAENWKSIKPEISSRPFSTPVGSTIINNGLAVTSTVNGSNLDRLMTIETVEVTLDATHEFNPDLRVVLTHTSPGGATSQSVLARQRSLEPPLGLGSQGTANYRSWKFSSVQHWGESTAGTWTLSVQDGSSAVSSQNGTFDSWSIQFHGTESQATPPSIKSAIRDLNLGVSGVTVVVPGFEPFDEPGGSMLSLAQAIRNRASNASGNDTSWLLTYESALQAFDPTYSHFPVFAEADYGGQPLRSAYSGNYAAAASDVSVDQDGNETNLDSYLEGRLGNLTAYVPGSLQLSFRYDPQDIENVSEALSVDVFHNGAWQTGVWSSNFADDGDFQTDQGDWQPAIVPLGSLGITNWSDIRFRLVASGNLDTVASDEPGTPGVDEYLVDNIRVIGNLTSAPSIITTIFFEDFENPQQSQLTMSDTDWRVARGSDFERTGEIVVLYDWAQDSRRLSSGWAEAAGGELFSLLVELGAVDPGRSYAADAGLDVLVSASHGLVNGDRVRLVGQQFPGGTNGTTVYYVVSSTTNTFGISLTDNGPAIDFTSSVTGLVQREYFDLHIIGHGTGAVVASEAVERMATYQIPVDHLTYLDPHDFDQGLVSDSAYRTDFAGQPLGYGAIVWNNVNFADVYYQTRGANTLGDDVTSTLVPQGRPIPGASNFWIGPGGLNYLPDPGHPTNPADYRDGNVLGDHRYIWEGFYLSTVNNEPPGYNDFVGLTKDTPSPATTIPVDDTGYAYSRVKSAEPRPSQRNFFGYRDRGNWQDGSLYEQGDVVKQGSTFYVANRTHTADGPTESQLGLATGSQLLGRLSGDLASAFPFGANLTFSVTIGPTTQTLLLTPANLTDLATAAASLQTTIRTASFLPTFTNAFVVPHVEGGQQRLIVVPGLPGFTVQFTGLGATSLLLDAANSIAVNALLSSTISPIPTITPNNDIRIEIGNQGKVSAQFGATASTLSAIATELQTAIRSAQSTQPYTAARVAPITEFSIPLEYRLLIIDGPGGGPISVQELSNRPVNATYWTALPSMPRFQDHRNSPDGIARGIEGRPDFAGLYQAGYSTTQLVDARWQPQWNPRDIPNGHVIHVGDDILQGGHRTIPGWNGKRIAEIGPTIQVDVVRNVMTLTKDNPGVEHRSLYVDPNVESVAFQMRVDKNAANDTLRVFLDDTLLGSPIPIPVVTIVPTSYAFTIPTNLRGQVRSLRFVLDGAIDGIHGKVEISQVGLEGYAASVKAGDITQIDLAGAISGVSGTFALTDPLSTLEREIIPDANFATNGKFHLIPNITNATGKRAEFAPNLWINFTEGGVDKTLLVSVQQGFSDSGTHRVVIPTANSVGTGGTNDPLQVRRVQQRLRYLNFRGHAGAMVPVDGNGTNAVFIQALKLFEAATRSPGPGNPAVALDADGLVVGGDSTHKWLNSPMAPGWTTLRTELQHPSQFDYRNYTTTWTHQALENAIQLRPELQRIDGEVHGFFSLTTYPDADPIQHGPDRSGLAFGMELQQGSLNDTGPAINLSLPLDLNQPAITDAERDVIRDILTLRAAARTEIRNVLIGGAGAQPEHARLRSILTALNVPNQAVLGHANRLHIILAAPNAQTALNASIQSALLTAFSTIRDDVVDALRMQDEFQNRLFTRHPGDTLESLLPLDMAIDQSLHNAATTYFGSSTSPTLEGLQNALDKAVLRISVPDSEDVLTITLGAQLTAINDVLTASFRLHASRIAATDQGTEVEDLRPALDILDYEDATNHIAVELDFDFDVILPVQNSPIDDSQILVHRDRLEVSAKSFNVRDYEANLFIMRVGVTHDPVILNGALSVEFDDEDVSGNISVADLKDPFLTNKISMTVANSEWSGYLPIQPVACAWLPVGENPVVTITDGNIFDGVPPTVLTNLDFDLLEAFTTLRTEDLFNAVDQLRQAAGRLSDALEPVQGTPFVDAALETLVEIEELAGQLADALTDGETLLFSTLQDLVQTLRSRLGLNSEEVYFDCSPQDQALYLNFDIQRVVTKPVEFAFAKAVNPLSISADIEAALTATMSIDLSLGFDLIPHSLTQSVYLSTLVADLNGNQGISTVAGNDLQITLRNGFQYFIDIDAINPTTIQDAYDAIVAPSAGQLTYTIVLHPERDEVTGVIFTDSTSGASVFSIARQNGSLAGLGLGVEGVDFGGDGVIDGLLRTRAMLDRIFLVEGGGLQVVGSFEASDIDASLGVFGVGGKIENGQLEFTLSSGLELTDPGTGVNQDGRLTLRELFNSPLASTADIGPILIDGSGRLPVVLMPPAFNALVGIDPNHPTTEADDGPELQVTVGYSFLSPAETPALGTPSFTPPAGVSITPNEDFQSLIDSLGNMSFGSVCDGITQVVAFLRSSDFTLFNQKLPLVNKSINELIEADSLLSDVIDVLCVDEEELKEDVEAILPDFDNPTVPVGAVPAIYSSLPPKQQTELMKIRDALYSALGQEDLSGLPTDLTSVVGSLRDFMDSLPNTLDTAQLNAFVNQLEALVPSLDKIETRVEAALGLAPNEFVMEFVDLDSNPTTFTRGLVFRLSLGAGFNDDLSLDFNLDSLDGPIPIGATSGGVIQVGLNGTFQLDFGIDLSPGVDVEDRLFLVAYDGFGEGTRLELTAEAHTDPQLNGSLTLGGIDLVSLGPAQVSLKKLETKQLTGVASQTNYPIAPVMPNLPTNVLDVAFVRVNGQMREASSYSLTFNQLTFNSTLPAAGDVIEILYPGTAPASYTLSVEHVVTPDDPAGDPERIIRFSRLFDSSDAYSWNDDYLNFSELDGMLGANLPLVVPALSPFTARAFWDLSDPNNPYFEFPSNLGTQLGASASCNLPGIASNITTFLNVLEAGLASDVLEKLPLIGKLDLDKAGVFIHDMRQIVDPMLLAMGSSTALRSYLFENLGPGTPTGTGLKLDILVQDHDNDPNTPPIPITSLNDIGIGPASGKATWVNIPSSGLECIQFQMHLGGSFTAEADFDLGLGGINIEMNTTGGVELTASYDVQMGFGLHKATGPYVLLNSNPNDPEIELKLDVGLAANTALDLRLFFLQLSAAEKPGGPSTGFSLDVMIDLQGPSNPGKLSVQEVSQTPLANLASFEIAGDVNVDLTLTAGTTNPQLPSIKVDLWVDWGFEYGESQPFMGRDVTVEFNNLRVDLGGYLTKIVQPIVQKIDESLKPLDPLIAFLGKEIPLVSDVRKRLGQDAIRVLDMVRLFGEGADSAVDFINQVISIRQIVGQLASAPTGTSFEIKFGNFLMGNSGLLADPRNSNANVNPGTQPPAAFTGTPDNLGSVVTAGVGAGGDVGFFAGILNTLRNFGVEFPLLDSPGKAFGLLFGQPVDFVTYDFLGSGPQDRLQTTFSWSQNFGPLLPPVPLYAQIGASLTMFADFKVGFDSTGLKKGAKFTDGFYFDDTRPVLGLEARFTAGAELNAGLAWGGVRGGVGADIGAGWNDINNDGKFRLKELTSRFQQGPHCVFDLGGEMNVFLEVYGGVGIKVLKKIIPIFQARKELLNATIFKFDLACPPLPTPVLAHVTSNTLVLNIGPYANLRQAGAQDADDEVEVFYDTDNSSPNYQKYVVSGFGHVQAFTGVSQILVEAGKGNDQITIDGSVTVPVTVHGGDGNDRITVLRVGTLASPNFIYGEAGNDRLVGGSGMDRLFGAEGDDVLIGGDGADYLEGNAGDDSLDSGAGDDELYGGDGDDDLDGGPGADQLYGESGNDRLAGGMGQNFLYGGDGDDFVEGGDDPGSVDTIHGGTGNDIIHGKAGNDVIYGEDGNDLVLGGDGDDHIYGGKGSDEIDAGFGNDRYYFDPVSGAAEEDTLSEPSGVGTDLLDFSTLPAGDDLTMNLTHGVGRHLKRTIRLINPSAFENVTSGAGNDTLIDNLANNLLIGGAGNDRYMFGAFSLSSVTHVDTIAELPSGGTDWIDFRDLGLAEPVIVDLSGSGTLIDPVIAIHNSRTLRTQSNGQHSFIENIRGGSGHDQLTGNFGVNQILGGPGDDLIFGLARNDWIEGNAGMDLIFGGVGDDTIDGGSENDVIYGEDGDDLIRGGDGDDTIYGNQGADEIYGDRDTDLIYGNDGPDRLFGGDGDDVMHGNDGDDFIEGNRGRDLVWGGTGNDRIYGNEGNDRLFGQTGDDHIIGGPGRDILIGDIGNDELLGGSGDDLISGGADNSNGFLEFVSVTGSIRSATGVYNFVPRWFGDHLDGGSGHDLVLGGNVTLTSTFGAPLSSQERLAYEVFIDVLRDLVDEYQASLTTPVLDEIAFVDFIKSVTTPISSTNPDGDDILYGGTENDLMIGHDGADHVFGDHGRDTLIPYRIGTVAVMTTDWIEGGPDDDRLLCGTYADNVMVGGTSDLNLPRTLSASAPHNPVSVGGGYVLPSCVIDETPSLDPVEPVALHGQKFLDRNGNQVRDPDEPGLNGWTIELRDLEGEIIATTVTMNLDLNQDGIIDPMTETGLFWFTDESLGGNVANLDPGTYQITEAPLPGSTQTFPLTGGQFPIPSGQVMTGVQVETSPSQFVRGYAITLQSGEEATGITFGNAPLGEVRGFKFNDLNGNGTRDPNEPFLSGWQITLQDANNNTQTVTTDEVGRYSFSNLIPGTYTITESVPFGWVQSTPGVPGGFSHFVPIGFGELVNNLDFGNVRLASVSGTKWEDLDGDGLRDSNEGAPQVPFQIVLTDSLGNPTYATTDVNGDFVFNNLYPGIYTLSEIVPPGWVQTYPTVDSFGQYQFIVESGDVLGDHIFGNYRQSSITGIKWNDLNGNGIYEPSLESGIPGWQVYLDLDENGAFDLGEPLTFTNGSGVYQFTGLAPGNYTVAETAALGWIQSYPGSSTDQVHQVSLVSGTQVTDLDFGNVIKSSIVGIKWLDLNADGIRDPNEPGLPNWRIYLDLNGNGKFDEEDPTVLGSITEPYVITQFDNPDTPVDETGWYEFDNLLPGLYLVAEQMQDGWHQSHPGGFGGVPGVMPGYSVTLRSQRASGVDFGNYRPITIEGVKWHDVNGDGRRQLTTSGPHRGDLGLGGWTIYLDINGNGQLDRDPQTGLPLEPNTTTTQDNPATPENEAGYFVFTGLPPGQYTVAEEHQTGWVQSIPAREGSETHAIHVAEGQKATVEFANSRSVSITGFKWWDQDLNRVQGHREPRMENWVIYLDLNRNGQLDFEADGRPAEPISVTNSKGSFAFHNLLPGFYVVAEVQQPHWSASFPSNESINRHFKYLEGGLIAASTGFGNSVFGDCNNDFHVGKDDQNAFQAAFHSVSADPNYVSCFDFDQDLDIDFADLFVFRKNLGVQASIPVLPPWAQRPSTQERSRLNFNRPSPSLPWIPQVETKVQYKKTEAEIFGMPPSLPVGFFATAFQPGTPANDRLFQIDPLTAGLNALGMTERVLIGLADTPGGVVYGLSESGRLVTVSLVDGSATLVHQLSRGFREGDIAFRPGDSDSLWVTTERTSVAPAELIHVQISSGTILSTLEIPIELSEFGFSGMQFLDSNTLYLYEPQTNKLVITDVMLANPTEVFLSGGPLFATRAGIDFDSNGQLWIVAKHAEQPQQSFLYYVDTNGPAWQMIAQGPGTSSSQWNSLLIINEYPEELGFVEGIKWHDLNGNGLREANEPGLGGWQIQVSGLTSQGQPFSAVAVTMFDDPLTQDDESGAYKITGLPFGSYAVTEFMQPGWIQSYPNSGFHSLIIDEQQLGGTANFGNFQLGSVHGTKYEFGNELLRRALPGWEVILTGVDIFGHTVFRTTSTMVDNPQTPVNETGQYWFAELLPGSYRIAEVQQAGWVAAFPESGFYEFQLISGESPRFDFYNYRTGTITGLVFQDFVDCEGSYTSSDVPLSNALVYMDANDDGVLNRDVLGNPTEPFTWTTSNGMYQFEGLALGTYRIRLEPSPGYSVSYPLSQSYLVNITTSGQVAAENDFGVFVYMPLEDGGDLIFGSLGNDAIYGDNIVSNRCVLSFGDDDRIHGEQGNDLLIGQRRNDTYYFTPSTDPSEIDTLIELEDRGTDDRDDEGRHDRLDFSQLGSAEPVEVDLSGVRLGWPANQIAFHQLGINLRSVVTDVAGEHNNLEDILGGDADDLITGNNTANWLSGGPGNDVIAGLLADDTYAFGPWNLADVDTVVESGGSSGGSDTLDFSVISVPVTVDLMSGLLASYGGANLVSSTPQWFENVIGGTSDDWIIGNLSDNRLEGGPGNDTYLFQGNWGNDTIIELAGQGTDDVFDFSGASGLITSTISSTSLSASDGFGNVINHTGIHIERIETGVNLHQVNGGNSANNWTLDGLYTGILHDVRFSNAPAIFGGPLADTFTFLTGGQFLAIGGGNGVDTIAGPPTPNSWQVDASGLGSANFVISFIDMETMVGGTDDDSLQGPQANVTWQITQSSGGTIPGYIDFTGFEQLEGGSFDDHFELVANLTANLTILGRDGDDRLLFASNSSITGFFDGGTGLDALDYSAFGLGITVNLQALTANGVSGFANVESLMGTSATDTLIGADILNTWTITGIQGTLNGLSFEDFEVFEGGASEDSFMIMSTTTAIELLGNDGDDLYWIQFGSLLGAINIDDNSTSALDRIELYGTTGDDAWTINPTLVSWLSQQVFYGGSIEQLAVFGADGDDTFAVIPSLNTQMFLDGGNHNTSDTLDVDKLGQTYIDNGSQVLVDGYQPVNYVNFEQITVLFPGLPQKPKSWAKKVDDFFDLGRW